MKNKQYIRQLIDKFFDGYTSNAEEKELFHFFSQKEIDEEFIKYQSVFKYFETDLKEELEKLEVKNNDSSIVQKSHKKRIYIIIATVAASLLLGIYFNPLFTEVDFNPYEGSYVMVNGIKDYDLDQSTIEEIEKEISAKIEEKQEIIKEIQSVINDKKEIEKEIYNKIKDKSTKYEEIINNTNNKITYYE